MNTNAHSTRRIALGIASACLLALTACGAQDQPKDKDTSLMQTIDSEGRVKPANPDLDFSDQYTDEAQAALAYPCAGLTGEEAAEILNIPEASFELVDGVDGEGNASLFCGYAEPGTDWTSSEALAKPHITVFTDGRASTGYSTNVADIPGVGTGTYGGYQDTVLFISPKNSAYEIGFAAFLPHDEMDFPTQESFRTASAQAAEAAYN